MADSAATVLVAFNSGLNLSRAIETLLAGEQVPDPILVVDNASMDESVAEAARRFPQIRVINAGQNLGYAGGNNLGLRVVRAAHIVILLLRRSRVGVCVLDCCKRARRSDRHGERFRYWPPTTDSKI